MSDLALLVVPVFSPLCNLAFALRREVFVIEQNIPPAEEFDAADLTATHLVAVTDGRVVGTLRIIAEAEHTRIGRVAVAADARGKGVAGALIGEAMRLSRERGQDRFWLSAQADKTAVYERHGFVAYGAPYDDGSGIMHLSMKTY